MNILKKLGLFHWNIGFFKGSPEDIITDKEIPKSINWLQDTFKDRFFADPFILSVTDRVIKILIEEYMYEERKGHIALLDIDKNNYRLIGNKTILDLQTHLSFPFIFRENNTIYVIPENSESGALSIYEYNTVSEILEFKKILVSCPLVDPVIVKYGGLYYLLCTYKGKNENADLYVYYSDSLMGDYHELALNPVKSDKKNTRAGGNFIENNCSLYRITQRCENSYGEGISINKIIIMNKEHFEEQTMAVIYPDKNYHYGLHTLNILNDITVIDGLKYSFSPIRKMWRLIK
jgi:hypothetical protein